MTKLISRLTKRDQRGFTLIELLVVIAIIAVLAALILAALNAAQQGGRDSKRKSDLNQYKTALEQFNSDTGDYPVSGNVPVGTLGGSAVGPCAVGTNYLTRCLAPPTQGGFAYIYVRGSASTFCISTQLERTPATGFEVTPTYGGVPANAPTAGTANGSACVGSA